MITLEQIKSWGPCYSDTQIMDLAAGRESITVAEVFELPIPAADRLWLLLQKNVLPDHVLHLFACVCARRALERERAAGREPDHRSWTVVEIAERYARGKATADELEAASNDAGDVVWDLTWAPRTDLERNAAIVARDAAYAAWLTAQVLILSVILCWAVSCVENAEQELQIADLRMLVEAIA